MEYRDLSYSSTSGTRVLFFKNFRYLRKYSDFSLVLGKIRVLFEYLPLPASQGWSWWVASICRLKLFFYCSFFSLRCQAHTYENLRNSGTHTSTNITFLNFICTVVAMSSIIKKKKNQSQYLWWTNSMTIFSTSMEKLSGKRTCHFKQQIKQTFLKST